MSSNFDKVLISTGAAKWSEKKKITKVKNYKKSYNDALCI